MTHSPSSAGGALATSSTTGSISLGPATDTSCCCDCEEEEEEEDPAWSAAGTATGVASTTMTGSTRSAEAESCCASATPAAYPSSDADGPDDADDEAAQPPWEEELPICCWLVGFVCLLGGGSGRQLVAEVARVCQRVMGGVEAAGG